MNGLRKFSAAFISLFLFFCFIQVPSLAEESENLILNGDFADLDEDGLPAYWFTDSYINDAGYTIFSVDDPDGKGNAAQIRNIALNDSRFAQIVDVEPESLYLFSADIMTDEVEGGHGANLSIEGVYAFSEEIFDTGGGWKHVEWYGETGPEQTTVTIFIRLGGYSGESTGKACFRNISLSEAYSVPGDESASLWFKESRITEDYSDEGDEADAAPFWPWLLFISAAYIFMFLLLLSKLHVKEELRTETRPFISKLYTAAVLCSAMLLRLVLAYHVEGYQVDVNCFVSWGRTMMTAGPSRFYLETSFCDYPPAYMYILGLNSWLCNVTGASGSMVRVIFRFFPSFCDIASCFLLYRVSARQYSNDLKTPLLVLVLSAFNPATILNSACWGQMDSCLCLLLVCVVCLALARKWSAALPLFVLAVFVKPQALIPGVLGLIAVAVSWKSHPEDSKSILAGLGISLLTAAAVIIPFGTQQHPGWLISLYSSTLGSYAYATVNTANLQYLLGGNWKSIQDAAPVALPVILSALCVLYSLLWARKSKGIRPYYRIEICIFLLFAVWFAVCAVSGQSWSVTGTSAIVVSVLLTGLLMIRSSDLRFLPVCGALLFILIYVFGIKMHERYIFPAILLLFTGWAFYRDWRLLLIMVMLSACVFVNEGIVLDNSIRLGSSLGHLNSDTVAAADLVSVLSVCTALLACCTSVDLCLSGVPAAIPSVFRKKEHSKSFARDVKSWRYEPDSGLHWNKWDTVILVIVTALFSVISLTTLGSTRAPQTGWTSSGYDEQIIFDLGEDHQPVSMLYFSRVSRSSFTVAQSDDLVNWSEEVYAQMDQGQCWKWKYVTESWENSDGSRVYYNSELSDIIYFDSRFIRLSANQIGLSLNEVIFRDDSWTQVNAAIAERIGGIPESELYSDPALLIDEQDSFEGLPGSAVAQPGWWNSTYFDEIYHARTAYEFLQGTSPYETTHPPLGKVIMSWFVAIIGMTPFGWRFAGALAGILMLPGIYLVCKQLTKKTYLASAGCILMALDCMHLTQTQLATIDSFPVLFIIFSFFFMLRFIQRNIITQPFRKLLPDLCLSGLFMGLAISSKWIGIYAGLGLAILFFSHCIRHIILCGQASRLAESADLSDDDRAALRPYLTREGMKSDPALSVIIRLCIWCLLFFIVIPASIYLLSYIPYMKYNTGIRSIGDFIQAVWKCQINMFTYHSADGLGMDHPFYSPWWQWPVIGKPMYYASEAYMADDGMHYSIFCFGNPIVWIGALGTLLACIFLALKTPQQLAGNSVGEQCRSARGDRTTFAFLFVGILAQYLPWVLVPRGTYIYHYFASVPFLVYSIVIVLWYLYQWNRKVSFAAAILVIAAAAVFFVILYPYASGILASESWLNIGSQILKIWY